MLNIISIDNVKMRPHCRFPAIDMIDQTREHLGMKLDAIDLRILSAVQADGRITKLALAEKAGLSP
ncbi:MAG: AsnC family transcriptional regulator, partial [Hoeflea sp.]|nr:AsnC family transcriptional regulator [Hoeflea sp.]